MRSIAQECGTATCAELIIRAKHTTAADNRIRTSPALAATVGGDMDKEAKENSLMKLAQLNMVCGLGMTAALVLAAISVVTYFIGLHGLWLTLVLVIIAALFWIGKNVTQQSIRSLEG